MKTKPNLFLLISLFTITTLVFQSCNKEEETNQPPTCKITSPSNGQEIPKGEIVKISVDINDSDGSITEVRFIIDDVGISSAIYFPYFYNWDTDNESLGSHTINVLGIDNDGGRTSDVISVEIIDNGGPGTFTDSRDGKIYTTVEIGDQIWFSENLNFETTNSEVYYHNSTNGDIYGRLYTWEAATTACPTGWHLPSDSEWTTLTDFHGGSEIAGGAMKETGTVHWYSPNSGATNSYGFTALPGGYFNGNIIFDNISHNGVWWSSSKNTNTTAWRLSLYSNSGQVYRNDDYISYGFSVRCLKD